MYKVSVPGNSQENTKVVALRMQTNISTTICSCTILANNSRIHGYTESSIVEENYEGNRYERGSMYEGLLYSISIETKSSFL